MEDIELAAQRIGPRLRKLRQSRGLTLRDLAHRVGISKNTLLRLEQGEPIAERIFFRICDALQTVPLNLLGGEEAEEDIYRIHRAQDGDWRIAFRRDKAPSIYQNFQSMPDPAERTRLGSLGFISGFFQLIDSSLPSGNMQAALLDLYGNQDHQSYRHAGEEFVFCMEGRLKLTIGSETIILSQGDACIFKSHINHRYESDLPTSVSGPKTRILMVWIESQDTGPAVENT